MDAYIIWLLIGVVCLIIEILNAGFGIICFGVGALIASGISACGLGIVWQLTGMTLGTFLSFLFVRPLVMRFLDKSSGKVATNLDNMVGRTAVVVIDINDETGRVAIDGTDWMAKTDNTDGFTKGERVKVMARDGNTLYVSALREENSDNNQNPKL